MTKRPAFQNIDRMKPRSQREQRPSPAALGPMPDVHVTAQAPEKDHILGTEGCYYAGPLRPDQDGWE